MKDEPISRLRFGSPGWPALILAMVATFSMTAAELPKSLPADHAQRMNRGLQTFRTGVASLLKENCIKCHGGEKTKGGLDISNRESLLKGGADGVVVIPFSSRESRLLKLIRHEEEPFMPDKNPKLSPENISKIAAWIDDGAPYDSPLIETKRAPRDKSMVSDEDRKWWSFQTLATSEPAAVQKLRTAFSNPVDRFITAKAAASGMKLTRAADKRTLIRRAYLDLLGMPPTPEEVEKFVRNKSPNAWPQLIDELLNRPAYGERWARHWLDVARFAESSGFEHDYDRPGAFHYRDFVIKALNQDLPFDQFIRWQIAGDEFEPDNPMALTATGFLGAGVFPTQITANEVERTRYDALDDMLSTTSLAFLGLTTGCARCHDHKYDPIPNKDYYRMLSTFTTAVRSVVDLDLEPEKTQLRTKEWEAERNRLQHELSDYEQSLTPKFKQWLSAGAELPSGATWSPLDISEFSSKGGAKFKKLADDSYLAEGKNPNQDEYTITASSKLGTITGLRLDALADSSMTKGGPGRADNGNFALSRIRVFIRTGTNEPAREVRIARAEADFEQNKSNLSIAASLDENPSTGWAVDPQFGKDHKAIFVFAEPQKLAEGESIQVRMQFSVNAKHSIGRTRLAVTRDEKPSLSGDLMSTRVLALLNDARRPGFADAVNETDRALLFGWWKERDVGYRARTESLAKQMNEKPNGTTKVLICAEGYTPLRHHTQGADFFTNTFYLKRGSTDLKDGVAEQGFLQVLMRSTNDAARWRWTPPSSAKYSGRRRTMANWLTDTKEGAGALAARVAVNRLWQHHFGRGIVATPNDFGRTGAAPTHPELLDWLAGELIRNGWKLKPLHKLIMTSATYMQSTATASTNESDEKSSALFIGHHPHRLEGEAIRDSILAVSGVLDPTMFGPGTKDEKSHRRSIYFTTKRSELIGSMVVFDQPEPLVSQGLRPTTTVAPQALFLMNGPEVRDWAMAFAERSRQSAAKSDELNAQITRAFQLALNRVPSKTELADALAFIKSQTASYLDDSNLAKKLTDARPLPVGEGRGEGPVRTKAVDHALADFCQVLFGLNEFCYLN